MTENRCERSGDRVWAYGVPTKVGTEIIPCPSCGAEVHMSVATSRLEDHARPAVAAA